MRIPRLFRPTLRSMPRATQGMLLGLCCAAIVAGLGAIGWLRGVERGTMDALFRARGFRYPSPHIIVLVADDATVARAERWPLPWNVHAEVVRRLQRAGAKTIAFDLLFSTPSPSPGDDADFIRACREAGNVVQAAAFHVPSEVSPSLPVSWPGNRTMLPPRFAVSNRGAQLRSATWVTSALPALQAQAPAIGHINIYPEADGALRRIPHLIRYRDAIYPSLALAAASHFLGLKPAQIVAGAGEIALPSTTSTSTRDTIPFDGHGETWVNWAGGNRTFATYSYNELFDGLVKPEVFKDRIVLIGTTAAGTFEHRPTPFSPVQPAIELQANAVDDILSNRPLRALSVWMQVALLLGFSALSGVLTAPRRALGGTLWIVGLGTVLWQGASLAMGLGNVYIPVAAPLCGGLLTYALTTALNYRWEWEANWRADEAAAALARGSDLMASVRDRPRLLAVINTTAREALGAEHVCLVLNEQTKNSSLREVARRVSQGNRVLVWPAVDGSQKMTHHVHLTGVRVEAAHNERARAEISSPSERFSDDLLRELWASLSGSRHRPCTIVAAPLPDMKPLGAGSSSELACSTGGALIAAGRRDGRLFTQRDAAFLETLARQSALALEHLQYYEMLRGRVELANRDLREAYDLLFEQSVKLTAAVESIDNALIVADESGRVIFANAASERILGRASPSLGQPITEALRESGQHQLAALFDELGGGDTSGDAPLSREIVCYNTHTINSNGAFAEQEHTDTPRRVLSANVTRLVGAERPLGQMLVVADVTAQRELDNMKSDFVSYVAHELRTPLTTILGYASLLNEDKGDYTTSMRGEMASAIMRHCRRLNRMISELLDIARLEAGRELPLRLEAVDAAALCEEVLNGTRASISDHQNLKLVFECEQRPLCVCADADRLEQVVINLVSNAVKYSPDGGTVTLRLTQHQQKVELTVHDTGMGMSAEQQAQLFQKYYRTPDAQARGIKGTGLGLYLVKQLVEAQAGDIVVHSEQGVGTTFTVTLPRPPAAMATAFSSN
jgi:signal transduction histidine kinase/CHASE2 domain-containing sensor protein